MTHSTAAAPGRARARLVPALATATLLALLTGCGGGVASRSQPVTPTPSATAADADPDVEVVGLPDGQHAEVTDSQPGTLPREYISFVSPVYSLSPSGDLSSPVVVRLKLDNALPRQTPVFVATRDTDSDAGFQPGSDADPTPGVASASPSPSSPSSSPSGSATGSASASSTGDASAWTWTLGRLTSDKRHVEFTTTWLGDVGAVTVDSGAVLTATKQQVRTALEPGLDATAQTPACAGAEAAAEGNYTLDKGPGTSLATCFGLEGGQRVLKVTNRRDVPVEVAHGKLVVVPGSTTATPAGWLAWSTALGAASGPTVLAPGSSAAYVVDLEPRSEATLSTTSGQRAVSLRVLRGVLGVLGERLRLFGTGEVDADQAFAMLVAMPQCARALASSADALLTGCLSPERLSRVLGDRAVLLSPVTQSRSFELFVGQQVAAVERRAADEQQRVVVRRGAPDFAALTGRYSGATRVLAIGAGGLVTESVSNALGAPVIELTYLLTDPKTANGTTTAAARLTKVTLRDRSLFSGRLPQAGDTGTLALTNGVVTSPYLSTSYCDAAAAARQACGS